MNFIENLILYKKYTFSCSDMLYVTFAILRPFSRNEVPPLRPLAETEPQLARHLSPVSAERSTVNIQKNSPKNLCNGFIFSLHLKTIFDSFIFIHRTWLNIVSKSAEEGGLLIARTRYFSPDWSQWIR